MRTALFFFGLVVLMSGSLEAGVLRLESESLFSAREGESRVNELPFYEIFSASYLDDANKFNFNTNFDFYQDFYGGASDFKLYLLNMSYSAIPDFLTVSVGRSLETFRTMHPLVTDALTLDMDFLGKRLKFGTVLGHERELSESNFHRKASFLSVYARYRSLSLFPLYVLGKFEARRANGSALPTQKLFRVSASQQLEGKWSPEILADSQYDLEKRRLSHIEAGVDLYPGISTALRFRGLSHEPNLQDELDETLFTIFSYGRLYEVRGEVEYRFFEGWAAGLAVAYDRYLIEESIYSDGYRVDLRASWFSHSFWELSNTSYYVKSFGGYAVGNRTQLSQKFSSRSSLSESFDVTYYEKITSSKRMALSSKVEFSTWFWSQFKLGVGAELNSNNNLKHDFRFLAKIVYLLWSET